MLSDELRKVKKLFDHVKRQLIMKQPIKYIHNSFMIHGIVNSNLGNFRLQASGKMKSFLGKTMLNLSLKRKGKFI